MAKSKEERRKKKKERKHVPQQKWTLKTALQNPVIRFLGMALGLILVFYVIWSFEFFQDAVVTPWCEFSAWVSSGVLDLFGYGTEARGDAIVSERFSLSVKKGCDGIEPLMLFMAILFAYPATLMQKVKGFVYGTLLIIALNFIRIFSLYLIGVYVPSIFDFMHIEFWQVTFIILALIIWGGWLKYIVKDGSPEPNPA